MSIENLTGSFFNDTLTGDGANNVLSGLDGNDTLLGGSGNDTLNGGGSDDTLIGGLGADFMNGDSGNDTFSYTLASEAESPIGVGDVITGFAGAGAGSGDQINLTALDANTLLAGNQAFSWIGGAAFTAAGQLRYASGVLQGNTDADPEPEFEIQLVGNPALFVTTLAAGTDSSCKTRDPWRGAPVRGRPSWAD